MNREVPTTTLLKILISKNYHRKGKEMNGQWALVAVDFGKLAIAQWKTTRREGECHAGFETAYTSDFEVDEMAWACFWPKSITISKDTRDQNDNSACESSLP